MQAWAIILIILVILIVLGLGIWATIYLVRKERSPSSGGGGSGGSGNGGNGPTGSQPVGVTGCPPTGATGATGTINGNFSLIPAGNRNIAMTITDVSANAIPQVIASTDPSKIYSWSSGTITTSTTNIANALIFGASIEGKFNCGEGIMLVPNSTLPPSAGNTSPSFVGKPGSLQLEDFVIENSWVYTPPDGTDRASTFCTGTEFCLFYDSGLNSITAREFNSANLNFRWILGPPNLTFT
jgi:hypothetical protein